MSFKDKIYSRKGITTLAIIMAVLVVGSGITASNKEIFADTTQSPEITASAYQAAGTNKMIFKAVATADVSYFDFWWNCPAMPEDQTEAQLIARCGQPQVTTNDISNLLQSPTVTGDLTKGVRPARHNRQAIYKKTLPSTVTGGKFVVFAKGTSGTTYRKTFTYTSGTRSLAAYAGTPWHVSATNVVSNGTKFLIEKINDDDGNLPLRRFNVWYNCSSNNLAADMDTLNKVKAVCDNPDSSYTQYTDRYSLSHLFTSFSNSKLVVVADQQNCSFNNYCQWWDDEPAKLVAKQDYVPANLTPTPIPSRTATSSATTSGTATTGPLSVALTNSIKDQSNQQSVTLTANVTDPNTAFASTNYTFWWNCTANIAPNSTYEIIKTACGEPQISGETTDPAKTRIGRKFNSLWVTGTTGRQQKNTLETTMVNYPATGPVTAVVLVERRTGVAVSQKVSFTVTPANLTPTPSTTVTVAPSRTASATVSRTTTATATSTVGPLSVALTNSIKDQSNQQSVTLTANVTDPNTAFASTNYTFWWNCTANIAPNSTYEIIKTACGEPQISGETADPAKARIGRKFDSLWVTGTTGRQQKNTLETTMVNYPATGPVTAVVLVERRTGVAVSQKVSFTVTPGGETTTKTLAHGYNLLGSKGELLPSVLTAQGMGPVWGFNTKEKPSTDPRYSAVWNRYPTDGIEFKMIPGNGYYVYNAGASKSVTLPVAAGDVNSRELRAGWNLLWTPEATSLANLKGVLYPKSASANSAKCIRSSVTLQDLTDQGIAYNKVYVIQQTNPSATSSLAAECQVFRLLGGMAKSNSQCTVDRASNTISNLGVVTQVPANKGFWFYIFPSRMTDVRTDTLTTGSKC